MRSLKRSRRLLLVISLAVLFFAPSALFAQTPKELPGTIEEFNSLLNRKRAETAALRAELERRRAGAQVTAITPPKYTDQTMALRITLNGQSVIGSGTIIGCSPSESKPDKYACFIYTAAHFFEARNDGSIPDDDLTPIDPQKFTIKGAALFKGGRPTVVNIPIKIIAVDPRNDLAIGLAYVDAPLPAAPLPPRGYVPPLSMPVAVAGCANDMPELYGNSETCVIGIKSGGIISTNLPPKPGDSGGGIFDSESGCVIGVCLSFSHLKDGTPLNIGNYGLAEHAYRLIDGLKRNTKGYANIDFKDGYLKVIPKSDSRMIQ